MNVLIISGVRLSSRAQGRRTEYRPLSGFLLSLYSLYRHILLILFKNIEFIEEQKKMMNRLSVFLYSSVLSFLFLSCGGGKIMRDLLDIQSYINDRPDSALVAIRQIDTTALRTKAIKAKYALLLAMSLDKNYIDTADTRIIQPAVDYYERHGSFEERLKAYMYLGTEQHNGGHYNKAIVSFSQAAEFVDDVDDQNLVGILYSKMAETFSVTQDYSLAGDYIDKSINSFLTCGRKDQLIREKVSKGMNYARLLEWKQARSIFHDLLSENSLSDFQRGIINAYSAMTILYDSSKDDSEALGFFNEAISLNGGLSDIDQICAYAYVLGITGQQAVSDSLFDKALYIKGAEPFRNYWQHRLMVKKGDFKEAYYMLWDAKQITDSISRVRNAVSAANSQHAFLDDLNEIRKLKLHSQRRLMLAILSASSLGLVLLSVIFIGKRKKELEKQGRMAIAIDALKEQLRSIEKDSLESIKRRSKARFSFLASLFEDVYHFSGGLKEMPKERLYEIINKRVKMLSNDSGATKEFERLLNEESDNIIRRFREDFYYLAEDEIRMASYVFAGFDNTVIMLIMGISTLENTRVKKFRLKKKIQDSLVNDKTTYLRFFE